MLQRRKFFSGEIRHGHKDIVWLAPNAAELSEGDWNNPEQRAMQYVLDGDAIDELGEVRAVSYHSVTHSHNPRVVLTPSEQDGQRIVGDTILVCLNGAFNEVVFKLPGTSSLPRAALAAHVCPHFRAPRTQPALATDDQHAA